MAEINNNIPNFGFKNIEKIEKQEPSDNVVAQNNQETVEQPTLAPPTDAYGRFQVKRANGGNIAQTIDETIALANSNPALMGCCEGVFDTVYNDLIAQGENPDDAYMQALFAEKELLEICPHN